VQQTVMRGDRHDGKSSPYRCGELIVAFAEYRD
jgi:hypothetical protein